MRRLMSLGAIIVVLLALTAAPQVVAQDATPAVVEPIVTGDFTFPQFLNGDGRQSMKDFFGQPVMIDIWGTH